MQWTIIFSVKVRVPSWSGLLILFQSFDISAETLGVCFGELYLELTAWVPGLSSFWVWTIWVNNVFGQSTQEVKKRAPTIWTSDFETDVVSPVGHPRRTGVRFGHAPKRSLRAFSCHKSR